CKLIYRTARTLGRPPGEKLEIASRRSCPTFSGLTPSHHSGTTYCVIANFGRTPMTPWVTQLRKGLVELCILAVLRKGEAYGYQIVDGWRPHRGLELTESTVYPVLSRLAKEGLLEVRTEASPYGPPRRYYRMTPASEKHYQLMTSQWQEINHSLNS